MKERKKKKYQTPKVFKIPFDVKELFKVLTLYCGAPVCCPTLFVWNGSTYRETNSLLPDSEDVLREQKIISDYYVIQESLVPSNGCLRFLVKELDIDISYFDCFKLYIYEIPFNTELGFTLRGIPKIFNPYNFIFPQYCRNKRGEVLNEVVSPSNEKFYTGEDGDILYLEFPMPNSQELSLIINDPSDPDSAKTSIHIFVKLLKGWKKIGTIHTRKNFSPNVIDLTPYKEFLPSVIQIKLVFTEKHNVKYVCLDTTEQLPLTFSMAKLLYAYHSKFGEITEILAKEDGELIELLPGDEIKLQFSSQCKNSNKKLAYVLLTRGYYLPVRKLISQIQELHLFNAVY